MLSTFIQAGRPPDFCLEEQICLYIGVENISTYFASSTHTIVHRHKEIERLDIQLYIYFDSRDVWPIRCNSG